MEANSLPKIAINTYALRQGGGVESYILDLIRGFNQANIRPHFYCNKTDSSLPENQLVDMELHSLSLVPKKLRHSFLSNFVQKNRRPDEVIFSLFFLYCDIYICGGNHKGYLRSKNKRPNFYERFIKIPYEQKIVHQCKQIIAHSQMMKNELVELYQVPESKVKVIYPPINSARFNLVSEEQRQILRQQFGFSKEEIIYLFPSTGHQRKGYPLLKAFFNSTDFPIKLVVAGTPVEPSKNVVSLGFCKNMPELYQAADFTIMASYYEPFGLVGLESLLSGTPVVFSENMACLEVMKGNFGFTFNRNEQNSLESAVKKSIDLVNAGKGRIENPLSCLNYSPSLEHHIQQLIEVAKTI